MGLQVPHISAWDSIQGVAAAVHREQAIAICHARGSSLPPSCPALPNAHTLVTIVLDDLLQRQPYLPNRMFASRAWIVGKIARVFEQ